MTYRLMTHRILARIFKATLMLIFCVLFIGVGLMAFVLFRPNIQVGLRNTQDWIFNNDEVGCDMSLPSLKGTFCTARDPEGNIFYVNGEYKIYIK
jgi:hypothetical protein